MVGFLVCLLRWCAGLALVIRLRTGATPAPPATQHAMATIGGAKARVTLLRSDRIAQPFACGVLRPAILLPDQWIATHPEALRAALGHEWAHVAHGDLFWLHLAGPVQAIYWFHPAIWWLGRRLRLNQDLVADAAAAERFMSREDYAAVLVQLARQAMGAVPATAAAWLGSPSSIRRRVTRLLGAAPPDLLCGRVWTVICLLIVAPTAVALGAVRFADDDPQKVTAGGSITIDGVDDAGAANAATGNINLEGTTPQQADPETAHLPIGTIRHNTDGLLTFVGEVIDEETKEPIADAIVSIRQELPTDSPKASDRVVAQSQHKTDARGRYHFNVSPEHARHPRLYMVCAGITAAGYAPQSASGYSLAMILKNRDLGEPPFFTRFRLQKGAEVSGRVVDAAGRPAANVQVDGYAREGTFPEDYGNWLKTRTDADGRFKLTVRQKGGFFLLPDEETTIDVSAEGPEGKKYVGSIKLTLPEGATREVEIEMRPAAAE